ncbi:MAG: molecular chaperone TorD family protein [Thermodesulfobacteriota bacterium]
MSAADEPIRLAEIYRFLAQTMRYPESSWFHDDYLSVFKEMLVQLEWQDNVNALPERITDEILEEIQVDYTRLFINAVPHVIAPPYASVYIDGTLNSTTADKTREYFRQKGFDTTNTEFPDHLVTELDFLSLLEDESEGSSEEFLTQYFRPWFEMFRDLVLKEVEVSYIKSAIELIDFFTTNET